MRRRRLQGLAAAIEQIAEKHGRLDVLVNNAGITRDGLILRMDDEDFDAVIDTNLKSAFVAIRAAARLDDAVQERADHQHQQRVRRGRKRRPGQLRRQQGGIDRPVQIASPRNWPARASPAMWSPPASSRRT